MNNIANEKGSISDSNGIGDEHLRGSNGGPAASAYARVRNTAPQGLNPGPLGLFFFASTTFIFSMYTVQADGILAPSLIISMACFSGGLSLLAAGWWEFAIGNLFSAAALKIYGGFWLLYAVFLYPGSGITAAYADNPGQLNSAVGIYLASWFIVTFIFLLATLRVNFVLILVFFLFDLTFLLLMIGQFSGSVAVHKTGGGVGIATAAAAFYAAAAQLLTEDISWFSLPVGPIPCRLRD